MSTTIPHRSSAMFARRWIGAVRTMGAVIAIFACSDAVSPDQSGTFFGPSTVMATGSARAYVMLDRAGVPTELGLALTESALLGLPAGAAEYVVTLPSEASATAFKHGVINWVAMGHPPAMVYTVPHFDFHFYSITNAERNAIVLGDAQLDAKMARQPAAEFIPAGYSAGMAAVQMGLHWNDPEAPERKGTPFTKTYIYGSYDGAIIFGEPMVAKAYLETKPVAQATPLKLPAQYSAHGYQPTSYTVGYDQTTKEYRVALTGLIQR